MRGVAKSFAQGDAVGANFRLALLGLPPLRGPRDAEMLKTGASFLARGFSPWTILRAAGIEGPNIELCKAEWNPDLHPRESANGRFVETDGQASVEGAKQNGEVGAKPPDSRNAWSSAVDAANHWLQTPVPEYDQDTGEQVGTRPRWRAIATNPIVVGAVGAAALLGGEAFLAPAAVEGAGAVASSAADALRLGKLLASEAQMSEAGTVMAGEGGRVAFRDAIRIAQDYSGNAADWVKKTSSSFAASDGAQFETHWVENLQTGQRVEFKTKFRSLGDSN